MESCREYLEDSGGGVRVRGYLHSSESAGTNGLVLTHGAGANCDSPLLKALASGFCTAGLTVLRCDLPFRQAKPHGPPFGTATQDREGLRAAVAAMRREVSGRVMLGGHSYGGRQASMLAAEQPGLVDCLLLLSYPLHPPLKPEQLRTAHFPNLKTPTLFIHGTRDSFGSIAEMEAAVKLIPARAELFAIEGAGHELMAKRNREELPKSVVEAFCGFTAAGSSAGRER